MQWRSVAGAFCLAALAHGPWAALGQTPPVEPRLEPSSAASAQNASRQVSSAYVSLGRNGQGALWAPPAPAEGARIGIVLVHPFASSLGNFICPGLAERGFLVLCADPPTTNRPFRFAGYEAQAQTIGAAIERLRQEPGVRAIVLAGYAEGGALAAFYQNIAQNGPGACQGPEKIAPCDGARLSGLLPAAALVLVEPDLGQAFSTLSSLDPAITVETAPLQRFPELDMYDPRNGFDPGRNAADYAPDFRKSFLSAQAERGARLVAAARKLGLAVAARERDAFSDDMPMFVAGALTTPLWQVDSALLARTKRPHKLLAADGSSPARILESIALPSGNPREATSLRTGVAFTGRQFLAAHAIEATPQYDVTADDIAGIVWDSSFTSTVSNVAGVRDPLLVAAGTAHSGLRQAEMILEAAASGDKEMVGVEGATHALTPCQSCAGGHGRRFGDTQARALDYISQWLRRRF
ncbi:MAG: hypothetical protein K2Y29_18360 [Beijerinckiaceae bacterium]|nr:hypothetical protein [Beijerinckiaceae bacterium]